MLVINFDPTGRPQNRITNICSNYREAFRLAEGILQQAPFPIPFAMEALRTWFSGNTLREAQGWGQQIPRFERVIAGYGKLEILSR